MFSSNWTVLCTLVFAALASARAHDHDYDCGHDHGQPQMPLGYVKYPYQATYPGDGEGTSFFFISPYRSYIFFPPPVTADAIFSGITTFARLPWVQCLTRDKHQLFDIAFIGAPFDTGTSYRPGARFGPSGIRAGSRRLTLYGGYNVPLEVNPFRSGLKLVDCGDIRASFPLPICGPFLPYHASGDPL
jgi:agmatinase